VTPALQQESFDIESSLWPFDQNTLALSILSYTLFEAPDSTSIINIGVILVHVIILAFGRALVDSSVNRAFMMLLPFEYHRTTSILSH
jgi:hypothetical protein